MKVTLRQRKKGDKIILYLDYYHKGKRFYEHLELYLYPEPEQGRLTKAQKQANKDTLALAESIRAKRHLEAQNDMHGFRDSTKLQGSFIAYMETLTEKRKDSPGNSGNWSSVLKHLKEFAKGDVTFAELDNKWLEKFKEYLQKDARTRSQKKLSQNSCYSYFNKVKAALRQAQKDEIIVKNPADQVKSFKQAEPQREFLSLEELQLVAKTDCEIPILKDAFLFSALTGLRWSDIEKLTWSEVNHAKELGHYIRFRQKKTKGAETIPISDQVRSLMGEEGEASEKVFQGLKYSAWNNLKLKQWMLKAGISKTITFHCARHTYATLQYITGTDALTISKLLGHRELKTTLIYINAVDEKKKESTERIKLDI